MARPASPTSESRLLVTDSDKLLVLSAVLLVRREEGTHIPAVMENWHPRPDFRSMDDSLDKCAKFSRTTSTAVNLVILNVARPRPGPTQQARSDHRAVEKMLFDGLKAGLAGVSLGEH